MRDELSRLPVSDGQSDVSFLGSHPGSPSKRTSSSAGENRTAAALDAVEPEDETEKRKIPIPAIVSDEVLPFSNSQETFDSAPRNAGHAIEKGNLNIETVRVDEEANLYATPTASPRQEANTNIAVANGTRGVNNSLRDDVDDGDEDDDPAVSISERIALAEAAVAELTQEKAKAKKEIRDWTAAFEARVGSAPTTEDKKAQKPLFVAYKKVQS